MSHTPGPWEVVALSGSGGPYAIRIPYRGATTYGFREIGTIEDARLIAAAPDLLAELKQLVRLLEPAESTGLNVPGLATLNAARAAIEKAEGK